MLNVEQAIREVGAVYQTVAGRPIQPGASELPPEADPVGHVEAKYRQLKSMLERSTPSAGGAAWCPLVDVIELEREIRIEVDVAGVPRDRMSISIAGDLLVLRGERTNGRGPGIMLRHQERPQGPFQKIITVPPRVRRDAVEATLRDGVLVVTLPLDGSGADGAEVPVPIK